MLRFFFPWLHRNKGALHATDNVLRVEQPRFVNVRGRIIARDIPYLIPKDVEDANRLDFQHYMLRVALKGLYAAPLEAGKVERVLDIATGTGRWAMEIARVFPRAVVTGFDHVPPPIDDSEGQAYNPGARPANYTFAQGNMFDPLPFPDSTFDFVHMRLVYAATPIDKWQPLIAELVRVTKPGGYVELVEGFIPIDTGPNTAAIISAIIQMCKARNIDLTLGKNIGQMLSGAGLWNVHQRTVHIPIGVRWGRLGTLCEKDMMSVFKGIGASVVATEILAAEDWNAYYSQMPGELDETTTLWPVFQAVGKKNAPIKR